MYFSYIKLNYDYDDTNNKTDDLNDTEPFDEFQCQFLKFR